MTLPHLLKLVVTGAMAVPATGWRRREPLASCSPPTKPPRWWARPCPSRSRARRCPRSQRPWPRYRLRLVSEGLQPGHRGCAAGAGHPADAAGGRAGAGLAQGRTGRRCRDRCGRAGGREAL